METIKKKLINLSLRKFFALTVLTTVCIVVILSGLIIWGCTALQNYLLPDPNSVYLTVERVFEDGATSASRYLIEFGEDMQTLPRISTSENGDELFDSKYAVQKIEKSYDTLSPKRKIVYQGCNVAMVAVPALLSVFGILFCGFYFYKRKLSEPLRLLSNATEQIAAQNLDFSIQYDSRDELGRLCGSFEDMRSALLQANREMWSMLEERRKLQASIAHDLRNPIAIIKGYAEYLQINLPKGNMSAEQSVMIANNLVASADRLERYTESVRSISNLEALEIQRRPCMLSEFLDTVAADMRILADKSNRELCLSKEVPEGIYQLDTESYSRVLENIFQNALRFANKTVSLSWTVENKKLLTTVTDDGPGFTLEVLKRKKHTVLSADAKHIGMGLTVSEILCEKHGGTLKLHNSEDGGAVVQFTFDIR